MLLQGLFRLCTCQSQPQDAGLRQASASAAKSEAISFSKLSHCETNRSTPPGQPNLVRCSMSSDVAAANVEYSARWSKSDTKRCTSGDLDGIAINAVEDPCSNNNEGSANYDIASMRESLATIRASIRSSIDVAKGKAPPPKGRSLEKPWHSYNNRTAPDSRAAARAPGDVWD